MSTSRICHRRVLIMSLGCILYGFSVLSAAVQIAPASVILSEQNRTGTITLQNPSDVPVAVSIFFEPGLPKTDLQGDFKRGPADSAEINHPRLIRDWVRIFPKDAVLAPGEALTIKFLAGPPKDLPDGEYWATVVITSWNSLPDYQSGENSDSNNVPMIIPDQTISILNYRKGKLISRLEVIDTKLIKSDSLIAFTVEMVNSGNAAYVGLLKYNLLDAQNISIVHGEVNIDVFEKAARRVELPITSGEFTPPYYIDIKIENDGRKDIPSDQIIPGNKIEYSITVQ
jgi:hypothetical protein